MSWYHLVAPSKSGSPNNVVWFWVAYLSFWSWIAGSFHLKLHEMTKKLWQSLFEKNENKERRKNSLYRVSLSQEKEENARETYTPDEAWWTSWQKPGEQGLLGVWVILYCTNPKENHEIFYIWVLRGSAGVPQLRLASDLATPVENLLEFSREAHMPGFGKCSVHVFRDIIIKGSHLLS